MPSTIMWFRRDLRLADNPAVCAVLTEAECSDTYPVSVLDLAAWAAGRTGYTIVDARLRQLMAQAGMDNRVALARSAGIRECHTSSGGAGAHGRVPPHAGMPTTVVRPGGAGAGGDRHHRRPAGARDAVPAPAGRERVHADRNCGRRARTRSA